MDRDDQLASRTNDLLRRARSGDRTALGELLEHHRPYLRVLSELRLGPALKARLDASDIVQQTYLSVHKMIHTLTTDNPVVFLAWLREVHDRNIKNVLREHLGTAKRSLTREEATAATMILEDRDIASSPSRRLMDQEAAVQLAIALETLSEPQREAIRLRFLAGLRLSEVAAQMQRSEPTVVGLISRALIKLRATLPSEVGDESTRRTEDHP